MKEERLIALYMGAVLTLLVGFLAGFTFAIGQFNQFIHGAEIAGILGLIIVVVGGGMLAFAHVGDWLIERNRRIEEAKHS